MNYRFIIKDPALTDIEDFKIKVRQSFKTLNVNITNQLFEISGHEKLKVHPQKQEGEESASDKPMLSQEVQQKEQVHLPKQWMFNPLMAVHPTQGRKQTPIRRPPEGVQ